MRRFLIVIVAALLIAAGFAAFVFLEGPRPTEGVRIPLGTRERALLAHVPQSAELFAVIPAAASVQPKLRANPVTRAALDSWMVSAPLPRSWMLGGADLVVWKRGSEVGWFADVDRLRALLVRNHPAGEPTLDPATIDQIAGLASHLPPGDALVVQRDSARGAYPPVGRPAVSSVQVTAAEVRLTSVAPSAGTLPPTHDAGAATPLAFPQSAILSAAFASAPRLVGDLNRLFGAKISSILEDGGMISIYDVKTRTFLPRPLGVIALPADPARRAVFDEFARRANARMGERDGMLLLSFDDTIDAFERDVLEPVPEGRWAVRIDSPRMVPILNALGQNLGLRIAAPRLYRAARDLDRWIGSLEQAKTIDAVDSAAGGIETLRVRITAK